MIRPTIQHWTFLAILLHRRIQTTLGDCDPPTVDEDKTHDGSPQSSYQTGNILNYSCGMGYDYVSGSSTSTCQSSGSWTSFTLTCQLGTCNSPQHPDNGRLIGSDFRVTKVVRFECDPGYARNGPQQIICYANRAWSASPPTCEEVFCPALGPFAHGTVSSSNNNAGSEVTITCDQYYIYSGGSNVRTCQDDGTWSGEDGVCEAINCGQPVIHLGTVRLYGTGFGASAIYTCNEGTVKEGADRSQCNANQQWDPPPPSCNLGCTAPNIANAIVTPSGSVTHGNRVTVDCDSGYNLNGAGQLTCRNGSWDQSLPTCVLDGTNTPDTTTAPGGPSWKGWEKALLATFCVLIVIGILVAIVVFVYKQYQKQQTETIPVATELKPSENGSSDPNKKKESKPLLHLNTTPESKNDPIDDV